MPTEEATEAARAHWRSWDLGLKGVTVFRRKAAYEEEPGKTRE